MTETDIGSEGAKAMFGPGFRYGLPADFPKEGPFTPAFICAVYIELKNDTFTIRHGYEPAGSDPAKFDEIAVSILEAAQRAPSNNDWKGPAGKPAERREIGFDHFTFASRQLVYFFIDNDPKILKFDERHGTATILRFSPYSGAKFDPTRLMKENHAFFNLKMKNLVVKGAKGQRAAVVEYWNTDEKGNEIKKPDPARPDTHYLYSLNLHVLMNAGKRNSDSDDRIVPVILDPDTGNVGSGP